jgi:hypothetical protein
MRSFKNESEANEEMLMILTNIINYNKHNLTYTKLKKSFLNKIIAHLRIYKPNPSFIHTIQSLFNQIL